MSDTSSDSRDAGKLWAWRARAELEAAARFRRVARCLRLIDAPRSLVDLAQRSADDELRHHERCAGLARSLDAPCPVGTEPAAVPLAAGSSDPRAQVLHEIVAMSCITETLSTALLLEMRTRASDLAVRSVVQEILRDEVQHARLGWAYLETVRNAEHLRRLSDRLPQMLAHTVHDELFCDTAQAESQTLIGLGVLPRRLRCTIFANAMRQVVFPGLRRHGIDTTAATHWLDARVP